MVTGDRLGVSQVLVLTPRKCSDRALFLEEVAYHEWVTSQLVLSECDSIGACYRSTCNIDQHSRSNAGRCKAAWTFVEAHMISESGGEPLGRDPMRTRVRLSRLQMVGDEAKSLLLVSSDAAGQSRHVLLLQICSTEDISRA